MPIVSKVTITPSINNPKPGATVEARFRVTQISRRATRVRVTFRLLGSAALVSFVTPSAPATGATVISQSERELVEEYSAAHFSNLVPVVRTLDLKADMSVVTDTLEVSAADFDGDTLLDEHDSMAIFGFVPGV